jgi:hypothetical protein
MFTRNASQQAIVPLPAGHPVHRTILFLQHGVRVHPKAGENVFVNFTGAPVSTERVETASAAQQQP